MIIKRKITSCKDKIQLRPVLPITLEYSEFFVIFPYLAIYLLTSRMLSPHFLIEQFRYLVQMWATKPSPKHYDNTQASPMTISINSNQ